MPRAPRVNARYSAELDAKCDTAIEDLESRGFTHANGPNPLERWLGMSKIVQMYCTCRKSGAPAGPLPDDVLPQERKDAARMAIQAKFDADFSSLLPTGSLKIVNWRYRYDLRSHEWLKAGCAMTSNTEANKITYCFFNIVIWFDVICQTEGLSYPIFPRRSLYLGRQLPDIPARLLKLYQAKVSNSKPPPPDRDHEHTVPDACGPTTVSSDGLSLTITTDEEYGMTNFRLTSDLDPGQTELSAWDCINPESESFALQSDVAAMMLNGKVV